MAPADKKRPSTSNSEVAMTQPDETTPAKGDEVNAKSGQKDAAKGDGGRPQQEAAAKVFEEDPFHFWSLLKDVISFMHLSVDGYACFSVKILLLHVVKIVGSMSFLIFALVVGDDLLDNGINSEEYLYFAGIGLVNVLSRLVPTVVDLQLQKLSMAVSVEQATAVVAKIFYLEHSQVIATPTGVVAQLLAKVFTNIDKIVPALYGQILPVIMEVLIVPVYIGVVYGWICSIQIVMLLVYTYAAYVSAAKKAVRNKDMMAAMFSEWGKLLSIAGSYERAHFFDNVDSEIAKAHGAFEYMSGKMTKLQKGDYYSKGTLTAVSATISLAFVFLLPEVVDIDTGLEMAALVFYFFTFSSSLEGYATGVSELRSALLEYITLREFTERRSEITDMKDAVDLKPRKNPSIEFKHVSFSYGGKQILDDISFKIDGGKTLGLVGASGCGKSTILRLMLRFYRQSSGTILIDGHDITTVTGKSLRKLFSVVTQDAQLMNASIRDNICYGKSGSSDEEVLHAANLAELDLSGEDLNLDKICGENGAKLSGGQRQRVALARAMLKNGTIYLLDEPTTGLDGLVAKNLQATLDELACQATTVTVTHHLNDLRRADLILYIEDGRIVERGTYSELVAAGGQFYGQSQARAGHINGDATGAAAARGGGEKKDGGSGDGGSGGEHITI